MEKIYLIFVGVLFLFAILDLVVGVSNDAVNFFNSAVASKAARRRTIIIIASLGILVGAIFSSGMMEVARKGIFHPDMFAFAEIMVIFLAVMITDVILLDVYNTLSLPTSTTVSIVFELLGAATAVSLLKIYQAGEGISELATYINSSKALAIISGILLSVVVAFIVGAVVQYLVRFVFTFNFKEKLKYYGSIRGGIAITAITYFLLIKGVKGSSIIPAEILDRVKGNTRILLGTLFVFRSFTLQILKRLFKINIPKIIVLVGTFSLAMAFAGNDLVNFIGVPIAGFKAFQIFIATPGADPSTFLMSGLSGKVQTETYLLMIAGAIMVLTLRFSSKARSVAETEIGLSKEGTGYERFGSSTASRSLVRGLMGFGNIFRYVIPQVLKQRVMRRFKKKPQLFDKDAPAYDMIRASVNLTVASILIAIATSFKLPLSTTYVTFMVAMGTSLSDRAWGRESATYRINGVFMVIGGWFLTAISAFLVAAFVAVFIYFGGLVAVIILVICAATLIYRTHILHGKKEKQKKKQMDIRWSLSEHGNLPVKSSSDIVEILKITSRLYKESIHSLFEQERKQLRTLVIHSEEVHETTYMLKKTIHDTFVHLPETVTENGHYYVQTVEYLRKISSCLKYFINPAFDYLDNNHLPLTPEQSDEIHNLKHGIENILSMVINMVDAHNFENMAIAIEKQETLLANVDYYKKSQLKRIKAGALGVRNSMLYITLLTESKNMLLYSINLLKAQKRLCETI